MPVMPASTEKLLTATAVLDTEGGDGTVTTAAVSTATPDQGVIDGDLYIVGAGDPLLATTGYLSTFDEPDEPYNDYAKLADAIKDARITEIHGNVVADESKFDSVRYLPSWPKRYITASEVGPLGALMVNDGFTGLSVHPEQPASDRHPGEPAQLAAETLTSLLAERGVTVTGSSMTGAAPDGAATVASIDSLPMDTNVQEMLRRSDNTTAEVLLKGLAVHAGQLGTTEAGAAIVQDTLKRLGLPADGSVTTDGSGLDLSNRVTCDLLSAALDHQGAGLEAGRRPPRRRAVGHPAQADAGHLGRRQGPGQDGHAQRGVRPRRLRPSASGENLTFAFIINGSLPNALTLSDQVGVALADYGKGVSLADLSPRSG